MTDTLMGVSPPPEPAGAGDAEDRELSPAELAAVEDLVRRARQAGIALTGPDGLLKAMTKTVVEAALGAVSRAWFPAKLAERPGCRPGTRIGRPPTRCPAARATGR